MEGMDSYLIEQTCEALGVSIEGMDSYLIEQTCEASGVSMEGMEQLPYRTDM